MAAADLPRWARPNPLMDAPWLTLAERAQVLDLVVATAVMQQRKPRGALEMPPFRVLKEQGGHPSPTIPAGADDRA